jgi:hypothetical protein
VEWNGSGGSALLGATALAPVNAMGCGCDGVGNSSWLRPDAVVGSTGAQGEDIRRGSRRDAPLSKIALRHLAKTRVRLCHEGDDWGQERSDSVSGAASRQVLPRPALIFDASETDSPGWLR